MERLLDYKELILGVAAVAFGLVCIALYRGEKYLISLVQQEAIDTGAI